MHRQYRVKSEKYRFAPSAEKPHTISRSKIDLFLECPRCFYLDQRLGVGRPSMVPLTLNNAVDELLKREFDVHRAEGSTPPLLAREGLDVVPFRHKDLDAWRDALRRGVQTVHEPTNLLVRGGIDDVWVTPDGELVVADYKATSKTTEINIDAQWQESYKRQVEVYQWLFRQNGFSVSDTAYFVYVNAKTDRQAFHDTLEFDAHLIPYTGSTDWIEGTLKELKDCLASEEIPAPHELCEYCGYREAAGRILLEKVRQQKRENG